MSLELFLSTTGLANKHPKLVRKIVNKRNKPVKHIKGQGKARIPFMADFETTTEEIDCRVWSWGLVEIETPDYDKVEIGTNIDIYQSFSGICRGCACPAVP